MVMLGYRFIVDFDVTVVPWFMLIYFSVTYLQVLLWIVRSRYSTRTNSLGLDLPNGRWQIWVRAVGFHLVLSPVWGTTPRVQKTHLYIVLPSTPGSPQWSLFLRFPHQNPVYASPFPRTRYMPRPSHSSRFYHPNNIGWAGRIIKLRPAVTIVNYVRTLRITQ